MRFLTGLQPSGKLHIGNYFGAIQAAIELQNKGEAFYFIANYHAMTTMPGAEALRANTYEMAVDLLACGLDPQKAVFFAQSAVPEVNELVSAPLQTRIWTTYLYLSENPAFFP